VKPFSADDSVAVCHAKVGNCQALKIKTQAETLGFFFDPFFHFIDVKQEQIISVACFIIDNLIFESNISP
jgi:hypothetical protein